MVRIYFLGGEDVNKRSSIEINRSAFEEAGDCPKALVFLWTTDDERKMRKYSSILSRYFLDLGVKSIAFARTSESLDEISRKIKSSDLIYIPGGLPKTFLKHAAQKGLSYLLSDYEGIIVGNSAGALVLCKECIITTGNRSGPYTEIVSGLGLVHFSVEVHYSPSKDSVLKELSRGREIYAIPEDCGIRYDTSANKFTFFGEIYLFKDGEKRKIS